jgi:peptide methionine sulfoxide reductase msrA/msrB
VFFEGCVLILRGIKMVDAKKDQFKMAWEKFADLEGRNGLETATVAGGCFWCMEGPFEAMDGVEEVVAGYTGGSVEDPTYEQVATDTTGHREAVRIYYDPNKVSFEEILDVFWAQIDPTDPGGQFADRGEQYKTAIFYKNEEEKKIAEKSKADLDAAGRYDKPVVTDILEQGEFYVAEDYHQDYHINFAERYKRYRKGSGREDFIERYKK